MPDLTWEEAKKRYPELRHCPEFILGIGNKRMRLLDATLADFRHYQKFLAARIARQERLQRRRGIAR